MIPQMQDRLCVLENTLSEQGREISVLRSNLEELRLQLQVERTSLVCDTANTGSISFVNKAHY